jgi:hypothetical protein
MAGAVHATVNDESSVYWNPAGMTGIDSFRHHIQTGYTAYFAGMNLSYVGYVHRFSPYRFLGLQVISFNSPSMPVTTEFQALGTGQTFSVNDFVVGASYAQVLTNNFSFGLTGKFAHEGIAAVATNNVLFDLGLQYKVGWQDIRFSAGLSHFGVNVRPNGKMQLLTLNGNREINTYESIAVPAIFRVGIAKEFFTKTEDHKLVASVQLNHLTDNAETFAIGGEYTIKKVLSIRAGHEFGRENGLQPAFGFGVKLPRYFGGVRADYSFNGRKYLGNVHRVGLAVTLK